MPELILPTHKARAYQKPFYKYMEGGGRYAALLWHRRSGKDDCAAGWTSIAAMEQQPAVYWHMLPEYSQARKAIWTAVNSHTGMRRIDEWFPPAIRKTTREQQMEIEFINGALWQVVGSDSFDRLVGASVKGVVFSEYALAKPQSWTYIRPILRENKGWAIFPSTPRGRNHWFNLYEAAEQDPQWFAQKLMATETDVFSPEALAEERAGMQRELGVDDGDSKFRQEYLCDWYAANVGAYYVREFVKIDEDKRITEVPYDSAYPVWTAWDLGIGDSTAIWFVQVVGAQVRVIDYIENSGVGLDWYVKELKSRPYIYERHIFPHDADHGELGTGKKRIDVLRQLGVHPYTILPRDDVDDGIQAARRLLVKCWFDREKCKDGIEMLRAYQRKWNDDRAMYEPRPLHNYASHGADAFRYLAVGLPERVGLQRREPVEDRYRARRFPTPNRWAS